MAKLMVTFGTLFSPLTELLLDGSFAVEELSKYGVLHGHGLLIMDPDAVYEYIKFSGLYSPEEQCLMPCLLAA